MVSVFREERSTGQAGTSTASGMLAASWIPGQCTSPQSLITANPIPEAPLFTWPTLVCLSELGSGPASHDAIPDIPGCLDSIFSSPQPLCPPLPNTCPTDNSVCLPYQTVSFIRAGSLYPEHLPQCPECSWPWMFIEWVNRGQTRLEKWPGVQKESRRVLWDSEMGVGGQNEWRELKDTNFQL